MRTCCSCRGPEFNFWHLQGGSQWPLTPVPGTLMPFLVSTSTKHATDTYTHIQVNVYIHFLIHKYNKVTINKKISKKVLSSLPGNCVSLRHLPASVLVRGEKLPFQADSPASPSLKGFERVWASALVEAAGVRLRRMPLSLATEDTSSKACLPQTEINNQGML